HRLTEGDGDLPADSHTGGRVGRDGGTHGGPGRVRGRTGGKAPAKVRGQRIARQVPGPDGRRGRVDGVGRERAYGVEGRGDASVGHRAGHRRGSLLQGEGAWAAR